MRVKIYIEGGGPGQAGEFREGWRKFFQQWDLAKPPTVFQGQSRERTWDAFRRAVKDKVPNELPILLVDSESFVQAGDSTWQHLSREDQWPKPRGAGADDAFLMICTMETWILAGWRDQSGIPKWPDFEAVEKSKSLAALERVSNGQYKKGKKSFELLGKIDARQVAEKCRSARALQARLQALLGRS